MAPRGIRNNNPGNIEYGKFARSMGATGSDGRFAKFPTPEQGIQAIVALQQRYERGGRETLFERISRWAPASDNNDVEAYANALARKMGIDINTPFSINDPVLGTAFIEGMIQHENGRQPYTTAQIQSAHGTAATGSPGLAPIGGIADVAALNPPTGAEPGAPTASQGFAPDIPDIGAAPAQQAIADMLGEPGDLTADQIDELTRTDVAGNYLNPLTAQPSPTLPPQWASAPSFLRAPRRPGPGGALGVDLGLQPAGMPLPPSRPAGRWLEGAGGAPEAELVKTPVISPLRPALGGPNDRRPQPPMPTMRPPDRWLEGAGGAPEAPPDPRMRPGAFQSLVGGRPEFPGALPPSPFESLVRGREGVPGALPPARGPGQAGAGPSFDPLASARMNLPPARTDLTPELLSRLRERQGIGPYPPRPEVPGAFPGAPSPYDDLTRAFDIPPPLARAADVRQPAPPLQSMVAGRPEYPGALPSAAPQHRSGEWFTPAPQMPAPMADANASRFDLFNMPSGQIMDLQTAFQNRTAPPAPSPLTPPIGTEPAYADDTWTEGGGGTNNDVLSSFDPGRFTDAFGPGSAEAATVASPLPPPTISRVDFNNRFWDAPAAATTGTVGTAAPVEPQEPEPTPDPTSSAIVPSITASDPQVASQEEEKRRGGLGRIIAGAVFGLPGALIAGAAGGGGSIFGIGPNGFLGNAGAFTPAGVGGSSPFNMQPGGAMGTTNWRQGSVTGRPNMQGTMWNRSGNNGSVGYVTDPFNPSTSMIYTGSPNRF